ncbi:unnamed protein product [Bursaphelenchus okinawaensis]|uniref:Phosphorylated adapter RNA export protein n=1 Tax=Bursaphelenchus okinawaensis TaxID=465554 RepID=A0A811L8H7_9BILA|nr:unnamed protein product [Bursaphelenchus okinawaensis]CAG9119862.1 unnamed protein product [Bursaphelenchus okinawaensis]
MESSTRGKDAGNLSEELEVRKELEKEIRDQLEELKGGLGRLERQFLEDEFKAHGVGEEGGSYLDRGAESYHIPEQAVFEDNQPVEEEPTPPNKDKLFEESANCEGFGVKKDVADSRKRKRPVTQGSSRSSSTSRPHSQGSNHNKHHKKKKTLALPFMSNGFSYESMYDTEVSSTLGEEELGKQIALVFGELDAGSIVFAVKTVGVELAQELYKKTLEVEKNGGMAVENGTRRRTPGGVFFKLLKDSDKVDKQVKIKINENSRKMMEKMRNEKQKQRVQKLKPLPKAVEVLLDSGDAPVAPSFDLKSEIKNLMDFD